MFFCSLPYKADYKLWKENIFVIDQYFGCKCFCVLSPYFYFMTRMNDSSLFIWESVVVNEVPIYLLWGVPQHRSSIQKFTCDADLLYTCSLLYIIDIQTNYLIEIQKELIYLCCDTFSSVVSTVHSEISLWYWCFVYFFFIACYKYTNKLNKENVLFYLIYWFARSKQIYNWMSFVITIHIELRVK